MYRIVVFIDVYANDAVDAYRRVNRKMNQTGLDWGSTDDEWFYPNGEQLTVDEISETRRRVFSETKAESPPTQPSDLFVGDCVYIAEGPRRWYAQIDRVRMRDLQTFYEVKFAVIVDGDNIRKFSAVNVYDFERHEIVPCSKEQYKQLVLQAELTS